MTVLLALVACVADGTIRPEGEPQPVDTAGGAAEPELPTALPSPPSDLEIRFLGVGGYFIRVGSDAVLTPPMYTNPDFLATTLGTVASDPALVAKFGAGVPFGDVDAVLVGHAHYDHLLDGPTLWPSTDDAMIYGNATMRHILAAFAPDRAPGCTGDDHPDRVIPRDRVFSLDDAGLVDYRACPDQGTGAGDWVYVDGTNVRFRALCSTHPDQIGPIHFAPGSVDEDQCVPPAHADEWLEGNTLAFLVDFLSPDTGAPIFRLYYQDAPTSVPTGLPDPTLLAEKSVDVALLNVGNTDAVVDHPGATLRYLAPRYTIGGHWEDFFWTQDSPPHPIPGCDVEAYGAAARANLPDGDEVAAYVDGVASPERSWVPAPGTIFHFFPAELP